jgi:hypothetical protein
MIGPLRAQELKVEGYFLQDSAKLGERVSYVLKAQYGPGYNIVFPDSTYDYTPFVYLGKKSYLSSTSEGVTIDSAVYFLSQFSLNPILNLALPVYEVFQYDSVEYKPQEAGLALKLMIDPLPEELSFQDNNVYQPIDTEFNYPLMLAILVVVLIISIVLAYIFGNKLKKAWQIIVEKQRYKRFARRWEKAELAFARQPDMDHADELLGLWKTYMERLNNRPFREWTTSEIAVFLQNKDIIRDFREIELIIYAGREGKDLDQACHNLKKICTTTYQQKITSTDERK